MIEEDPKIQRELLAYIRELDAEGETLEFKNSKDFEQRFLLPLFKPEQERKPGYNVLQGLKPEIIQYLNNALFAKEPPFPGDILALEIAPDTFAIEKCNLTSGKVFGEDLDVLIKDKPSLEKFVQAEFLEVFQNFKKKISTQSSGVVQVVAIETPNREIWVLEIEAKKGKKGLTLFLRNKRSEVLKLLGKEDPTKEAKEPTAAPIDVVVFRYNAIHEQDVGAWVTKVAALTKKLNLWPENSRPKFIVTRFEDEKRDKSDFYHPLVDDMICLPFDRLIVLQKLEIIRALPEKISPSYLFVQDVDEPIEVGKKVSIEFVSDLGFAVANPFPLSVSTPGHFYFRFPGQKQMLDCFGKVTHSMPHPERENEHLVYFSYFGLDKNILKEVRAYLGRDSGHKMILNNKPADYEYNPDNIFISDEQKRRKNVAVLDLDERNLENITTILKKDIGGLNVITDTSYYNFFRNYLSGTNSQEKAPPAPKEDFYDSIVALLVGVDDNNLQMSLTPPAEDQTLLGHNAQKLFSTPQGWLDLFNNDHARNLLSECFHLARTVRRLQRPFELNHADGTLKTVNVEIVIEDNGVHARVNLSPVDPRAAATKRIEPIETLDLLLVDIGSIPNDLDTFISGVKEAVKKSSIKTYSDGPKFILMGPEKVSPAVFNKAFAHKSVVGLISKPVEVKRLCYLAHCALDNPFTIYRFDNIGWKADSLQGKITREAQLVELAEFGAAVKLQQKLKTGSMIYLFKSIYASAPDMNVTCRVYHSEELENEKGAFMNYVTYYGITDAFLKFTRSYIRETYAEQKAKESGGAEE